MQHEEIQDVVAEKKAFVMELLKQPRPWMLSSLAQECGLTEMEVAQELPRDMCTVIDGGDFEEIWGKIGEWEKATFIVQHSGHVIEVHGKINAGKNGYGYYNIFGDEGLGGHIKADAIAHIAFLSMSFMGKESHSLQFFGADGSVMFSVYLGRRNHEIIPSVREQFLSMKAAAMNKTLSMRRTA